MRDASSSSASLSFAGESEFEVSVVVVVPNVGGVGRPLEVVVEGSEVVAGEELGDCDESDDAFGAGVESEVDSFPSTTETEVTTLKLENAQTQFSNYPECCAMQHFEN